MADGKHCQLLFPNADIIVSEQAWERALNPHYRDRASFIPELIAQIKSRKNLHIVNKNASSHSLLGDDYRFHLSHGHTPGLLLTEIAMPDGPIVFAADLIPGAPWVHLPITMGYDRYPELLINEKENLLSSLLEQNGRLFFTHDSETAIAQVAKNKKGKFNIINELPCILGLTN
jgi:glyoxylase-like metal-dependent hydrolase (beta-lactamase superfamily II)